MVNALTIDVEDYYHVSAFESVVNRSEWERYESRVEKNTQRILDILEEFHVKATFFVLGWIAERHPKLVQEIQKMGHEVASHGYSHRRIYTQTPKQFKEETKKSKQILEDLIGKEVIGYRAASYSITEKSLWALDILIEEGFLYDSSVFPVWHDRYGIPNSGRFSHEIKRGSGKIQEYPPSTLRFGKINIPVAGGGYLRIFPYSITKWAIKKLNTIEKQPAIVYFHPWEVDPDQPRIKACRLSRFRHYVNLQKTEETIRRLCKDFQFAPINIISTNKKNKVPF